MASAVAPVVALSPSPASQPHTAQTCKLDRLHLLLILALFLTPPAGAQPWVSKRGSPSRKSGTSTRWVETVLFGASVLLLCIPQELYFLLAFSQFLLQIGEMGKKWGVGGGEDFSPGVSSCSSFRLSSVCSSRLASHTANLHWCVWASWVSTAHCSGSHLNRFLAL